MVNAGPEEYPGLYSLDNLIEAVTRGLAEPRLRLSICRLHSQAGSVVGLGVKIANQE